MSIFGIGTDILKIQRVKEVWDKYGDKFVDRILHPTEIPLYNLKSSDKAKLHTLAKAFCAKEAFFKALGTGVRDKMAFNQIAIIRDQKGKPEFVFYDEVLVTVNTQNIRKSFLSLSDEKDFVVAYVILEL